MDDIVPGLLNDMTNDFQSRYNSSSKIQSLKEKLDSGEATYKEANEYASEVGNITKDVYSEHLTSEKLPDGKCYYNIADRVTNKTLHNQYELVADYSEKVQTDLNKKAGIGLKAQRADEDTNSYHSLANHMSSAENYDDVAKSTAQSAERMAKETVDNSVKKNVEFQGKSGLKPKIVRKGGSKCCSWCSDISGTYDYPKVPNEVYARHNNCTCTVEYDPGSGKRQDVHTKQWRELSDDEIKFKEELKKINVSDVVGNAKIRIEALTNKDYNKKDIEKRLTDVGFKKIDSSFYNKVDIKLQMNITEQLENLEKRFGAVGSSIFPTISANGTKLGTTRHAVGAPARQELIFSSRKLKNYNTFVAKRRQEVIDKFCMPCKMDNGTLSKYVVTHEYGHMVSNICVSNDMKIMNGNRTQFLKQYQNEIENIARTIDIKYDRDKYISDYVKNAPENKYSAEFFAECFANSQLGQPNVLGQAMIKWLERRGF